MVVKVKGGLQVNYIPWRLTKSWTCLMCGRCCKRYAVNLTWKEYSEISKFWPDKVRIRNKEPYLGRKMDGRCEFLWGNACFLEMVGMKPLACKLWPFMVLTKPLKIDENFDGLYRTNEREYFVYLNPNCYGINRGNPVELANTIEEVIKIWNGSRKEQYYSTSRKLLPRVLSDPLLSDKEAPGCSSNKKTTLEGETWACAHSFGMTPSTLKYTRELGIESGEV